MVNVCSGGVERVGYRGKRGEGDIVLSWESGYLGRRVVIEDVLSGVFDRLFSFFLVRFKKGEEKREEGKTKTFGMG